MDFDLDSGLIPSDSLIYGFYPSGQRFAAGFLQIPPRDGHPCHWLYLSCYRADSGLSPVRNVRRQAHDTKDRPPFPQGNMTVGLLCPVISKVWIVLSKHDHSSAWIISPTTSPSAFCALSPPISVDSSPPGCLDSMTRRRNDGMAASKLAAILLEISCWYT